MFGNYLMVLKKKDKPSQPVKVKEVNPKLVRRILENYHSPTDYQQYIPRYKWFT